MKKNLMIEANNKRILDRITDFFKKIFFRNNNSVEDESTAKKNSGTFVFKIKVQAISLYFFVFILY